MTADQQRIVKEVALLRDELAELRVLLNRNSSNSSLPPSSDTATERALRNARKQSSRTRSGRKPGKQPGAPGSTLRHMEHPDVVVRHEPVACGASGCGLQGAAAVLVKVVASKAGSSMRRPRNHLMNNRP